MDRSDLPVAEPKPLVTLTKTNCQDYLAWNVIKMAVFANLLSIEVDEARVISSSADKISCQDSTQRLELKQKAVPVGTESIETHCFRTTFESACDLIK